MHFKKTFKQIIKKLDLFKQQVSFRYNEEPEYQTLTGGFISIILIAIFIGIFATTLLKTFDRQYIDFNQKFIEEESPSFFTTTLNRTFLFVVGIDGIDVNSGERYFDVYMQSRYYTATGRFKQNILLQPCRRSQWADIGFGQTYDRLGLNKWLCPHSDTVLQIQGKFTSQDFRFYKITTAKCNATLIPSRPCMTDAAIQTYLNVNQAFRFNFYFVNTILNSGSKNYIRKYIEDTNYFPFSKTNGVSGNLFISSYSISTDQSLYPIQQMHEDQGGVILTTAQTTNYQVRGTQYCKVYLRKSPISIQISRSFRRVDDTLSYIGGLFSTIVVILAFMNLYNELSYQIQISKNCYYYDKNQPFDGDKYNILTFIIYLVYTLFDKVSIELPWPTYKKMHRFLEEGRKHLDMRVIMKKILFAERLGLTVLDESKYKSLLMQQPLSLDEAEKIRKDLRCYKNFRKRFFPSGTVCYQENNNNNSSFSRALPQSTLQLNQSKYTRKVLPLQDDFSVRQQKELGKVQNLKYSSGEIQQYKQHPIRHEQEFELLQKQMKIHMLKLYADANEKGDPLAKRIYDNIDQRVKRRYINFEDGEHRKRKINMSLVLDKIPE